MTHSDPTIRGQELGAELRALREATGLTIAEAAKKIDVSVTKMSRLESGQRGARIEDVAGLLAIYRARGATRRDLLALAREVDQRGWWQRNRPGFAERQHTLISLESRADRIINFETVVVPGLLQTGEYTRAIMVESGVVPENEIEDRMVTRLRRHSVLSRRDPPDLVAIIDELVLHRVIGGKDVLRRQLEHLLEWSTRPNIKIRVLPNTGGHAGVNGAFEVMEQPDRPAVVFLENLTSSLFVEDRHEVDVYRRAIKGVSSAALDEQQSMELIASVARRLDTEESTP